MSNDRVFRKCAWRLIPFMGLLFLVNFIDRTNAGFAALTMNKDLGFSPTVFGFGAGIFFFSYALCQVPANLILERLGARRWLFCIMAVWGFVSASNALVQSPIGFYVVRFLLGVAEAGLLPGTLLYLTYWFPRGQLALFTSYFAVSTPLSFVVGGPLASVILGMDGFLGLHGWQWLFLIEGVPAVLLSFAVLKVLPDGPRDAAWLTAEEKNTITVRLAEEEPPGRTELWPALRDPRVLAFGRRSGGLRAAVLPPLRCDVHGPWGASLGFNDRGPCDAGSGRSSNSEGGPATVKPSPPMRQAGHFPGGFAVEFGLSRGPRMAPSTVATRPHPATARGGL